MTRSIFRPYLPYTIGRLKKEWRPGTKFNGKLLQRVILEPMDSDTLNRYTSLYLSIAIGPCEKGIEKKCRRKTKLTILENNLYSFDAPERSVWLTFSLRYFTIC